MCVIPTLPFPRSQASHAPTPGPPSWSWKLFQDVRRNSHLHTSPWKPWVLTRQSHPGESSKGVCLNHSWFCFPWPPAIWCVWGKKESWAFIKSFFVFSLYATILQKYIVFELFCVLNNILSFVLHICCSNKYKYERLVYSAWEKTYVWFHTKRIFIPPWDVLSLFTQAKVTNSSAELTLNLLRLSILEMSNSNITLFLL